MTDLSPEAMAERDLPCSGGLDCQYGGRNFHRHDCVAHRRPAVAAQYKRFMDEIAAKDAEIGSLKRDLAELRYVAQNHMRTAEPL